MKNLLKIVSIIGLTTMTQTAYTAEVTDTYNTGDTLTATTLGTIKSAVNDNNARIDTVVPPPGPAGAQGPTGANSVTGNTFGDMQVWDGTAWVLIPVPVSPGEASLHLCGGLPTYNVCIYAIGDTGPAGGIVFYVTDGGAHGLEAAPVDAPRPGYIWGCNFTDVRGADASVIGAGGHNTIEIVVGCQTETFPDIAGFYAAEYTLNGFSDWFLPSRDELDELFSQKDLVDPSGLSGFYWSSTEGGANGAVGTDFGGNGSSGGQFKSSLLNVRAVRAF